MTENRKFALSILGAVLAVFGFGLILSVAPEIATRPYATPTPGGIPVGQYRQTLDDFVLTDQSGKATRLSDWRGKPVLLTFGYTYCPDVCPLTLTDFKTVKTQLGPDGEAVQYVLITLDPKRDTSDVLMRYVGIFDPSFTGLTGSKEAIDLVVGEFDASYELQPPRKDSNDYLVSHTSFMYLVDQDGLWRVKYPFQTPPAVIAADIRDMLDAR
jgi:protein SCO1/2